MAPTHKVAVIQWHIKACAVNVPRRVSLHPLVVILILALRPAEMHAAYLYRIPTLHTFLQREELTIEQLDILSYRT